MREFVLGVGVLGDTRFPCYWRSPDLPAPAIVTGPHGPRTRDVEAGTRGAGWILVGRGIAADPGAPVSAELVKPPYAVPSMDEIADVRGTSGFRMVSTFSGCGGSCLGFEMAGFKVLWASEFIEAARETYALNHDGVVPDARDIREVLPEEILAATGLRQGELDVFEGSPPCASFSTAGKRQKGWGEVKAYSDTRQRTDDLFFEFTRILEGLRPKVFVAENVSGLVKGVAKGYFKDILRELKRVGYVVEAKLLDAQWLGVPQSRQRVIFVGVREDLHVATGIGPAFPKPLAWRYSVRDALPWLSSCVHDTSGEFGKGEVIDAPSPAITVGVNALSSHHFKIRGNGGFAEGKEFSLDEPSPCVMAGGIAGSSMEQVQIERAPESLEGTAIGREWDKLAPGGQSDKYFQLVRPDPDAPSPTITQLGGQRGVASVTHPLERRKFTIAELRRICGFPDDFQLTGKYEQQWERLGRAVPPVMMAHVARAVRDRILVPLKKAGY